MAERFGLERRNFARCRPVSFAVAPSGPGTIYRGARAKCSAHEAPLRFRKNASRRVVLMTRSHTCPTCAVPIVEQSRTARESYGYIIRMDRFIYFFFFFNFYFERPLSRAAARCSDSVRRSGCLGKKSRGSDGSVDRIIYLRELKETRDAWKLRKALLEIICSTKSYTENPESEMRPNVVSLLWIVQSNSYNVRQMRYVNKIKE